MSGKTGQMHGRDHRPPKYGTTTPGGADPIVGTMYLPSAAETDGQVLTRDSTTTYGIKWAAGGGGGTKQVLVPLDTPDSSGNAYAGISILYGFSVPRAVVPVFSPALDGTWEGRIVVPNDYASAGAILLSLAANNTAGSKAARFTVSTAVIANGGSLNTAYTDESYVNISVPTTANQRFDQSYTLTTTPVAGSTMNVKVTRNGSNGGDTLTTKDVLLWHCYFYYST